MKHSFRQVSLSMLACLFSVLGALWLAAAPAGAQLTFVSLSSFTFASGVSPYAGLVQGRDGDFYGTTRQGGASNKGTIFEVSASGVPTTLYSFTGGADGGYPTSSLIQGNDGDFYGTSDATVFKISPSGTLTTLANVGSAAGLVLGSDGDFYGTTSHTVFKMTPSGTLTTLYTFSPLTGGGEGMNKDGSDPSGTLVQGRDGNFYGTTTLGGLSGYGTVFKISPSGSLTTLVNFTLATGAFSYAGLVQGRNGDFYGTTSSGGASVPNDPSGYGYGTVFKVSPSGTLTTLFSFTGANGYYPAAALIQGGDGNFYGTTAFGGPLFTSTNYPGNGTVFKISPSGTLTTLLNFTGVDGDNLQGSLIQGRDGNLYGTTANGGPTDYGTVFKVTSSGILTTLLNFAGPDGSNPSAPLIQAKDGDFYGTTQGGPVGYGTVFRASSSGVITTLYTFTGGNDGRYPNADLVQGGDGDFYGTTAYGGSSGTGTVFKITASGTLTTLHSFSPSDGNNRDGVFPFAGLVQGNGGNFYGTAFGGGTFGDGTVYKITPQGALTTLVDFTGSTGNYPYAGNGSYPYAGLILGGDGNFYGTTNQGGSSGAGTVFKVTPSGTLTTLVNFTGDTGGFPYAGVIQGSDGDFYGTTEDGSPYGGGTAYKVSPAGVLTTFVYLNGRPGVSAGLIQGTDGNFYGTTDTTAFKVTPGGVLTTLYTFQDVGGDLPSGLVQGRDGNFYGTTYYGGSGGIGTIFGLFGPPATHGASVATTENVPVAFTLTFDDPSGQGVSSAAFPTPPAHGTLTVNNILETDTTGTVTLTYAPTAGYVGADSFAYTVTGYVGTSLPQTVTLAIKPRSGKPTITGVTPATGVAGTSVTITGTNLMGTTVVGFDGHHPTSFTVNAAGTQITTTVPSGATTGRVAVITPGGETFSSSNFTIPAPPTITGFAPTSGAVGATVTIMGTNLQGTTVVGFNGHHPTSFTVSADGTQITTTVPSGATTGKIAVIAPGGEAFSSSNFTVTP